MQPLEKQKVLKKGYATFNCVNMKILMNTINFKKMMQ